MSLVLFAYYLPETEYVHWARAHPIVGLVNLVAAMKGWKRMFLQIKEAVVDDIYVHMVDAVPDLMDYGHRTTAMLLLLING
ncbi:hypothetical protein BT93_L2362 [Corymbia citriodora subsp. variegata]|uniref:Uncharacterized protein n=1 Tax=Corymbia citriodora subsp. variegata TaxID=360336 RepID=A0A8T0CK69_CORYI|nr:hypothetical protein BT93_L2362 [Corymbia citriodora subsp. variegata]KAF7848027.1 hypothetical protein BT93_L2362 [Corymbia citriodora subsp. variegata]